MQLTYRYCSLMLFWNACRDTYVSLVLVTVLLRKPMTKAMSACTDMQSSKCNLNPSELLTGFWGCGRRSGLCRWSRRSCSGSQCICQLNQKTDITTKKKPKRTRTTHEQNTTFGICSHLNADRMFQLLEKFKFDSINGALEAKVSGLEQLFEQNSGE